MDMIIQGTSLILRLTSCVIQTSIYLMVPTLGIAWTIDFGVKKRIQLVLKVIQIILIYRF